MARGQITVDTAQLDSTAKQVDGWANDYNRDFNKLFEAVKAMKSGYTGKDNEAFTSQIEGFRDDFQRMERLMRDYADYLRKIATTYRDTQDSIAARAKTLSQGS